MEVDFTSASRVLLADFDTGKLYWKPRDVSLFCQAERGPESACKAWNARYAGREAFTSKTNHGYLVGDIFGRSFRAQRVIWLLYTGSWPLHQVDHINGNRQDNRITNLRDVPNSENGKNQRLRRDNKSGVAGVRWIEAVGKWVAYIKVSYRHKHLGEFKNLDDAIQARRAAEGEFGFHENHGSPPVEPAFCPPKRRGVPEATRGFRQ